MQTPLKFLTVLVLTVSAFSAFAHGMYKHKPLTLEELPKICQQYFTRAETCYKKAGAKSDFQRNNTKFLFQSLPAADLTQHKTMCKIAMDSFARSEGNV